MKCISKLVFVFFLSATVYASTPNFETITIASYNVENFWDAIPHNTDNNWFEYTLTLSPEDRQKLKRSPQYIDYSKNYSNWHNKSILKAKIKSLVKVLELMKYPEIVALQEIESARNHTQFFETPYTSKKSLKDVLKKLGYKYFLIGEQNINNPVSVTTAFISKIKLNDIKPVEITDKNNTTSARDIQAVELKISNSERLVLFNNHWKSKRGNGNETARIETAQILKKRILFEKTNFKNTHVIVLGDLNTAYTEKPLKTLNVTGDKKEMLKSSNNYLYNLWYDLPYEKRWESSFNGLRNTLSHILISDSLFNTYGFHYVDKSFKAIGQDYPEKKTLLNEGGVPFRWQIKKQFTFSIHIGKGYSDHLPLMAQFKFLKKPIHNKQKKQKINYVPYPYPPIKDNLLFNEVKICSDETAINLVESRFLKLENYLNKCVKIDIPYDEEALTLFNRGRYRQTFIKLPLLSRKNPKKTAFVGISMSRSFDWRPNIDDSRVTAEEANTAQDFYHENNWHPKSNKCFTRKVLQGKGGSLRKIVGYVAYQNGYLTIHANSREENFLILEDLPQSKKEACPWN